MNKRIISLIFALPLVALLTACGGSSSSASPDTSTDNDDVVTAESESLTLPEQLEVVTNEN